MYRDVINPEIEVEEIPFGKNVVKIVRGDPHGFWKLDGIPGLPEGEFTSNKEAHKVLDQWLDSQTS